MAEDLKLNIEHRTLNTEHSTLWSVVSGCYEERHEFHEFFNRQDAKDAKKGEDQGSGINHAKHERPAAAKKHKESLTRITRISTNLTAEAQRFSLNPVKGRGPHWALRSQLSAINRF